MTPEHRAALDAAIASSRAAIQAYVDVASATSNGPAVVTTEDEALEIAESLVQIMANAGTVEKAATRSVRALGAFVRDMGGQRARFEEAIDRGLDAARLDCPCTGCAADRATAAVELAEALTRSTATARADQ